MSDPYLAATKARGTETLPALARWVWATDQDGATCPPDMIPTPEALAEWFPGEHDAAGAAAAVAVALCQTATDWCAGASDQDVTSGEAFEVSRLVSAVLLRLATERFPEWTEEAAIATPNGPAEVTVHAAPLTVEGDDPGGTIVAQARFHIGDVHELWRALPDDIRRTLTHPLVPIVRAWQARAKPLRARHVITPGSLAETEGAATLPLTRRPGVVSLASLSPVEAVEVDGEPLATATATRTALTTPKHAYRRLPVQGELIPGPRTIGDEAMGDLIIGTVAGYELSGDERNPIRGDVLRLADFAYAITGAAIIPPGLGAVLIGGNDTPANRQRWWIALKTAHGMVLRLNPRTGEFRDLLIASIGRDGTAHVNSPLWWRGGREDSGAWRLSGGLFRPALIGEKSVRGTTLGYWGALARTIAGLEAALSWSPAAGRGKDGRIPDLLRPASGKTGPGPEIFVPWRKVLELSGEHVLADADSMGTHGVRYRRRVQALKDAGYEYSGRSAAPAGDTIEVKAMQGTRTREAGLLVHASARMVEAVKRSQDRRTWTRLPAESVFRAAEGRPFSVAGKTVQRRGKDRSASRERPFSVAALN